MSDLNQDSPLSEKIKQLAQAQLTDDKRLQVLIYLTAELAARQELSRRRSETYSNRIGRYVERAGEILIDLHGRRSVADQTRFTNRIVAALEAEYERGRLDTTQLLQSSEAS